MKTSKLVALVVLLNPTACFAALPAHALPSLREIPSSSPPLLAVQQKDAPEKKMRNIGVAEFEKLRADKKNVVLDVRTSDEFAAGHISGAINLDVNSADFEQKVAGLDKNKSYLVHCAAGVRSARACDKMSKLDFSKLYNLEGGFKAWEKAGHKAER